MSQYLVKTGSFDNACGNCTCGNVLIIQKSGMIFMTSYYVKYVYITYCVKYISSYIYTLSNSI